MAPAQEGDDDEEDEEEGYDEGSAQAVAFHEGARWLLWPSGVPGGPG
jgi:hypothetical protein